jgi:hypothetical protein
MNETAKIRELNDAFRTTFVGGRVVATAGVANLPNLNEVLRRVREYTDFSPEKDPHHEHDFGNFELNRQTIFWKVDYYTHDLDEGSSDPADEAITARVLTIMLSSEY